jgi:hypothetical protein
MFMLRSVFKSESFGPNYSTKARFFILAILWVLFLQAACSGSKAALKEGQRVNSASESSVFELEGLILGSCINEIEYFEIPLKNSISSEKPSSKERWTAFFEHALIPGWKASGANSTYWNVAVPRESLNHDYIRDATNFQIGNVVQGRTLDRSAIFQIYDYSIECSEIGQGCLLLALGKPLPALSQFPCDRSLIIANQSLPLCDGDCPASKLETNETLLEDIASRVIASTRLAYNSTPERFRRKEVDVLSGHFTRKDHQQFVAFVNLYWEDNPGEGDFATVILDGDLSIVTVLSERGPELVIPVGAADINRDALDEIWVVRSSIESAVTGVYLLDALEPTPKFHILTTR